MPDLSKVTPEQWLIAAAVLRGAAEQADEYDEVLREQQVQGDPLGLAGAAVALRRIATDHEEKAGGSA